MSSPSAVSRPLANQVEVFQQVITLLVVLLATLVLYTFLHESGHALLGLLFGGKLTAFSINFWDLSAHAGLSGEFTDLQRSLISLAGVSLPLLAWLIFLIVAPKKGDTVLEWFKLAGSMAVLNTLLAWIVIPFLYLAGRAPADDCTNFLRVSGAQPLFVSGLALLVYLYGWVLLLNKFGGVRGLIAHVRLSNNPVWTPSSRRTAVSLFALSAATALIALGIRQFYPFADILAGPEGYTAIFSLDLSDRAYADETVYRFRLDEPASASLFFGLQEIKKGPVHITLIGPRGYENTFISGDTSFNAGKATVHPRDLRLDPGSYRIVVTFPQTPGKVTGFWVAEPVEE